MNHKASSATSVVATMLMTMTMACGSTVPTPVAIRNDPTGETLPVPAAAWFGRPDENGRFMRLTAMQLVDGRAFGWRIRLPCSGPVEYSETMQMPSPGDWRQITEARATDPKYLRETAISADGTRTTTHEYAACIDGWIQHSWTVAREDPVGEWTIRVEIPHYAPQIWRVTFRR